jgi:hypothetical protein
MTVRSFILRLIILNESSVKHDYDGQWKNENTRLTTCDPHARRAVTSSESPQVIEDKKDVIFTFDVAFEVSPVLSCKEVTFAGCFYDSSL